MSEPIQYGPALLLPGQQIRITTNPNTEPFWEAARDHKLTACKCAACGHFRMPPSAYCPECSSREVEWPTLPGTGTVFSYVVCNKNPATGEDTSMSPSWSISMARPAPASTPMSPVATRRTFTSA